MQIERGLQSQETKKETLGRQIEYKVGEFFSGSFDFIDKMERTKNNGPNDKKGVDLVVTFKNESKMAIDITADVGSRVDEKIKSMRRSPLVGISEERNDQGKITIEKSKTLIPRALIRVDIECWEEYNIERLDNEVIVYMPDKTRIQEEKDILQQLLRQIEYFSRDDKNYKKATGGIKDMLNEAMGELEELEKDFT